MTLEHEDLSEDVPQRMRRLLDYALTQLQMALDERDDELARRILWKIASHQREWELALLT